MEDFINHNFNHRVASDVGLRSESTPPPVQITAHGGEPSYLPATPKHLAQHPSQNGTTPVLGSGVVTDVDGGSRGLSTAPQDEPVQLTTEVTAPTLGRSSPQKDSSQPSQPPRRPLRRRYHSPSALFGSSPSPPTVATAGGLSSPTKHTVPTTLSRDVPRRVAKRSDFVCQTGRTPLLSSPCAGKNGNEEQSSRGVNKETQSSAEDTKGKGRERVDANKQTSSQMEPSNIAAHHPFSQVQKAKQLTLNDNLIDERSGTKTNSIQPQAAAKTGFPAPRAPPCSPFCLPERSQERARAKKVHPALASVRRQTISDSQYRHVPSIDLTTLSTSTSHNSFESSTKRRSRRYHPAHVTPPLLRGDLLFTSAGPSTRPSSPLFPYQHGHFPPLPIQQMPANTTTLARPFPTSAFTFVSPVNSHVTSGQLPSLVHTPLHHAPAPSTTTTLTPHPADLHLVTAHGLTSLLLSMSANHGFALHVAMGVYRGARNLRETDEVLRGMREAAEGHAEGALGKGEDGRDSIERQNSDKSGRSSLSRPARNRRESPDEQNRCRQETASTELNFDPVPPSDTESEYSPPETTRAAEWKRRSMGGIPTTPLNNPDEIDDKDRVELEEDRADQENVGVEVEDALVGHEPITVTSDEPNGDHGAQEKYSVLMQKAKALEQELGKARYRRHIVSLFR